MPHLEEPDLVITYVASKAGFEAKICFNLYNFSLMEMEPVTLTGYPKKSNYMTALFLGK